MRVCSSSEELTFSVADDGPGFDAAAPNGATGLQGMADRLAAVGGALTVHSAPGAGTVSAVLQVGDAPT
jgi:signal transduction histidine kinase